MADDPILTAFTALLDAKRRAEAAGETVTREHAEEFLRLQLGGDLPAEANTRLASMFKPPVRGGDVAASMLQGLTLNTGDDLLQKFGYTDLANDVRQRQNRLTTERPGVAQVAEIAGSLPQALIPVGAGMRGAKAVATAAGIGGVTAGVDAAGRGASPEGVAATASVGTVLGGLFPVGAGVARRMSPTGRAESRMMAAIDRAGGPEALRETADAFNTAGRGNVARVADLAPELRTEADFVANTAPAARETMQSITSRRQANMTDRLLEDVRAGAGPAGTADAPQRLATLVEERRAWANSPEGFAGLREANQRVQGAGQALAQRLQHPSVRAAWDQARKAGNMVPDAQLANDPFAKSILEGRIPRSINFADLQDFKERLDDTVQMLFNKGQGNLANSYKTIRDEVRDFMRAEIPGYEKVAQEYAERSGWEQALESGRQAWNVQDTRGLQRQLADLTPRQREEFRYGMASELIARLRATGDNRNVAAQFLEGGDAIQDKLKVVFGSQARFDEFMQRVASERTMARLNRVTGGSETAFRQQNAGFDPLATAAATFSGVPAMQAARTGAAGWVARNITQRTAEEMTPMLVPSGRKGLEEVIDRLYRSNRGKVPTYLAPYMAGRGTSSLLNAPRDDRR